jgi:hypothetical protein
MVLRTVGIISLASGLMFAAIGMAHAVGPTAVSAPELDPANISAGIAILSGGVLLLAERHRKRKSA